MLSNRYGHFENHGKAYVVTDTAAPTPWVNVVSNGRYGFVVSHNGGGFSWLDNSQLNVLTRWEMDLARDDRGRSLYLADRDDGQVWSVAPAPCRPKYDAYRCEHTLGQTTFTTEFAGIRAVWTMAVAPGDPVEIWRVQLTNLSDRARRLRIASFFEWCCGVAPDSKREFHRLFFTTSQDPARHAVFATKNMWDLPPRHEAEHWNRPWPYVAAHAVGGLAFETRLTIADKETFFGRFGQATSPAAMTARTAPVGAFGRVGDASGALGGDFTLPSMGQAGLFFLTVVGESREGAAALIDRYATSDAVNEAVEASAGSWERRLAPTHSRTAQPDFDLLNNYWLPYQAISGRLWGRTGYYQQSGAFGFRDQLQDSMVWLDLDPARCREQILLHAHHQFADGSVYHWWHPLAETGLRTMCSDDYLWLPFVTAAYIKETGDLSILNAKASFVDEPNPSTVLDHCERAFRRAFSRFSDRGLPLIGSCDWNDGLSAMGVAGRGESVWLGQFLCPLLEDFAQIYSRLENPAGSTDFLARRGTLARAINAHAWDGAWYRYGTKDNGQWVGSGACDEGKIHLNAQTWAILSGVAPAERARAAWDSVKEHLVTDFGPLLLAPAYTTPDPELGYITRYAPGARENGGVYMHAATWALAAACRMGDTQTVGKIWRSISPPVRAGDAEAYRAEPYVTPGNVDGPGSATPGRAGWTWYTGSAQWLRRVGMEWMLGVRPTWDGLLVDPCVPLEFGSVTLQRRWRGCDLRIKFDARLRQAGARARLLVNGVACEDLVVRPEMTVGHTSLEIAVTWAESLRPTKERGEAPMESSL